MNPRMIGFVAMLLAGCTPAESNFMRGDEGPGPRARDFAECRIKSREIASHFQDEFAARLQFNATLRDCMTAKGV